MALIVSLIFFVVILIFAIQNPEPVSLVFLTYNLSSPKVLVILASAVFGGLVVGLIGLVRRVRLGLKVRQLQAQNLELESQLASAREEVRQFEGEIVRKAGPRSDGSGGESGED